MTIGPSRMARVAVGTSDALRDRVADDLRRLRGERNIRPPTMRCTRCGTTGPAAEPRVSVRAMIISLRRFGIADSATSQRLEKQWKALAKKQRLGLNGRPRQATPREAPPDDEVVPEAAHTGQDGHDPRPSACLGDTCPAARLGRNDLPCGAARSTSGAAAGA